MRAILSIAAIASGLLLVTGVLKGAYVFIPLAVIALSVLTLGRKQGNVIVVEKEPAPDKEKFSQNLDEAEEKFHEDKKKDPGSTAVQMLIDKLRKR